MIRVGSIGLGGMGSHQARAFNGVEGCKLVAGADPSPEMRARFAETFPGTKLFDSTEAIVNSGEVDAVVIAVPTGLHCAAALTALNAGLPVLVEKPMARTVEECRRLNEAADRKNTFIMVAHCRRFDPHWKSWGAYVASGHLGSPILWRNAMAGFGPGRWYMDHDMGGGPLMDGAVHNYDFANFLFGDPESVLSSSIDLEPESSALDTCSAIVRYGNGNQLLMSWSWAARGNGLHDIIGPKGFIQFGTGDLPDPEDADPHQYCCFTDREGEQTLIKAKSEPDMYAFQAEHFLSCVRGDVTCLSPGTEAIKAIAIADAILQAGPGGEAREVVWT